jgi:phytoene dehydrogenase-like protein
LSEWVERTAGRGNLASLLHTLLRVSTYTHDPGRLSAGAALDQLRLAQAGNVLYLDGGWQTLVDGLRDRAVGHGAEDRTGARAEAVHDDGDGVGVRLAGGESIQAGAVDLAIGPDAACRLLHHPPAVQQHEPLAPARPADHFNYEPGPGPPQPAVEAVVAVPPVGLQ